MKRMIALAVALMLTLVVLCAAADMPDTRGMRPRDAYQAGAQAYENKEYADAAVYFEAAGNHRDALMWAFYCQAISLIIDGEGTEAEIERASARFELLAEQSFQQAEQWAQYCKGREWEFTAIPQASICYSSILVHDSLERYLRCNGKSDLLETEAALRARVDGADIRLRGEAAYEVAVDYYDGGDYAEASSYFWLAGNYADAPLWRFYCQAIQLVEQNEIEDAFIIFDLLVAQGFAAAESWSVYCEAREWEAQGSPKAENLYKTIFVYDSAERYLRLKGVE